MLKDRQISFVVVDGIEDVGGIAQGRGDHFGLHTTKLQKLSLTYYMHNLRERLRGNATQLNYCFN